MSFSRNEFEVMTALLGGGCANQRQIASYSQLSLGLVNETYRALLDAGYVEGYSVTDLGKNNLAPYRVENAVILAAGLSSRLAPISYDRPKGALCVRGEVLIERQIRQLQEAGIGKIVVVVGYKKEEYFYLEDKFGVQLVSNAEYMERNNHSSIWAAKEVLGNSYICMSDTYFCENPFREHEYSAYADAVWLDSAPNEYFLKTKGKKERIVSAKLGGKDGWAMFGHAYWDRVFTAKYLEILENEYLLQETKGKLWEDIFFEHASELKMCARRFPENAIYEFDSLDEVREFDPLFIQNVSSDALDNICNTLGCRREEVGGIAPIKQGLTNLSFYFSVKGEGYVYRHPGAGTNKLINRAAEAFALRAAADLGLDKTFVHASPEEGWKISKFLPGCMELDYADAEQVGKALGMARKLHEGGVESPFSFDAYDEARKIIGLLRDGGWAFPSGFDDLSAKMDRLVGPLRAGAGKPVLCHNDFYAPNFLICGDEISLIDWEYAAMGDYGNDFGNFVSQSDYYSVDGAIEIMPLYFGRTPSAQERFHLIASVAMVGWYWYVWAMYKELEGAPAGEWLYVWYRAAKGFCAKALEMLADGTGNLPQLTEGAFEALAYLEGRIEHSGIAPEEPAVSDDTWLWLQERGLAENGEITPRGVYALEPYRVKRAVLLAAGFGSRLLPVTVNTPKPLARVHGVRIIDRLIDAVMAAGITEIYIVRGYLAEEFDQLLVKYPNIRFIDNPLYDSTNNISSAVAAAGLFEEAYVFESDLLLANPGLITRYQYSSNYLGIAVDRTDDWCFDADDDGVITNLAKGKGAPCWQMVGASYWTKQDGRRLASDIPEVFALDDGKQIFWDDVALLRKREGYRVRVRPCSHDDIVEIDDFEDLQRIDPAYVVKRKNA